MTTYRRMLKPSLVKIHTEEGKPGVKRQKGLSIMNNLGFSANAVSRVLSNKNWVDVYRTEFKDRLEKINETVIPKQYFLKEVKPLLESFVGDRPKVDMRKIVQKWMLIFTIKAWGVIRIQNLISNDKIKYEQIYSKYSKIPSSPLDSEAIEKMSKQEKEQWHEGSLARAYSRYNYKNILGLFCSELFFAVEAACRVVCIGTCLDFSIKSLLSNMVIQHDEVFKTLKRIGSEQTENVSCITCVSKQKCHEIPSVNNISALYELCYHIRAIKDYKLEFYWEESFEKFLEADYLTRGVELLSCFESILDSLFSGFLMSPFCSKMMVT